MLGADSLGSEFFVGILLHIMCTTCKMHAPEFYKEMCRYTKPVANSRANTADFFIPHCTKYSINITVV
jgi:hypothetical protein